MKGKFILTSHKTYPIVSVITVVYNGQRYVEETILSVLSQTYPNIEYIIIDGGSTDETLSIIKKYEDEIDYWSSEKDQGMYYAINKGLQISKGEIIGILNSDDIFYDNNVVTKVASFFLSKNIDGLYGNIAEIDENSKILKYRSTFKTSFKMLLCSEHSSFVPHPSFYISRKAINSIGCYDESYKYASDFDFILTSLKYLSIYFFNDFIVKFRIHSESISSTGKIAKERIDILNKHNIKDINFLYRKMLYWINWGRYKAKSLLKTWQKKC